MAAVHVVRSGGGVEQVFARREDAEAYVAENPGARISCHVVRQSLDEAHLVYDRRVVIVNGVRVRDVTDVLHDFVDEPNDAPAPAEVEWFYDTTDSGWHIVGFGTDQRTVDAQVENTVGRVRQLGRATELQSVGGASA